MKFRSIASEYWPLLLPALFLLPGLSAFPFPGSGAPFSDLAVTHYPNAVFLRDAILNNGTIPLWNPSILSGYSFIAHPYSGIWYPPYWAALFFPLPLGLNLLTAFHLIWAGAGMYALLRQRGLSRPAAIFGGLAFGSAPKIFAHIGAGHLMLVFAVSWTPWLLWSVNWQAGASRIARLVSPAAILAVVFFIDPRWAVYSGLLLAGWWAAHSHRENLAKRVLGFGKQIGLALLFVFPAAWLFVEYAQLSTRAALAAAEVLELSLPPTALLGLIFPQWASFHEWVVYPGIIVFALAIISFFNPKFRLHNLFWVAVLVIASLISFGESIPGAGFLTGLPMFDQLRIPPRAMFLAAFGFSALAAPGFQFLLEQKKALRSPRLVFVSLIALTLMFAGIAAISANPFWQPTLFVSALLAAVWLAYEQFRNGRVPARMFIVLVISLLVIDLGVAGASLIRFRVAESVLNENQEVAEFLATQPGQFRVYSPSYSIAQQTAADYKLELANGVDPLQLETYAHFMESATGVPRAGYSVSLPPFAGTKEISETNAAFNPDPFLLGLLNVKFIVSDFPLEATEFVQVAQIEKSFIYENSVVRPRAWVETDDGRFRTVTKIDWAYNRITIEATGPGRVVLSEIVHPGWIVSVDGQPDAIEEYQGILRSVVLPEGEHEIIFEFAPPALWFGLFVPLATVLAVWLDSRKQK
jgi:hypothetical protein